MNNKENNAINILLVEDDEIDIQSVARVVNKIDMPINLNVARNGLDALNQLSTAAGLKRMKLMPNLIILDINMPKMNGVEFLEKLRTFSKLNVAKIIILTTSNDIKDRLIFSNLKVDAYLTKPLHMDDLLKVCKNLGAPQ